MARKILLADDSVTAQNMGRKILADAGYEVITVNNGSAALKKIAEAKPDVIVLDVYMPGYSGLEVCQRLKESAETSRMPVLLTVGKLEPFKPEEAKRVRADAFIVKPFEASELLSALSKLEDKVVPRSEHSKSGRFARAIAAVEDAERPRRKESENADSGWKKQIVFPKKKSKEEEEQNGSALYNTVNRDLRTVPEQQTPPPAEESQAKKDTSAERETRVDLAAVVSEGLPKDVTPEEIAALTAAAAQMQTAATEASDSQTSDQRGLPGDSDKINAADETRGANQPNGEQSQSEVPALEQAPALEATFAQHRADESAGDAAEDDPRTRPNADVIAAMAALEPANGKGWGAGSTEDGWKRPSAKSTSDESRDVSATMAASDAGFSLAGPRWTAVPVALDAHEAATSLEIEMQKAHAAFAAADAGHAGFTVSIPEPTSRSIEGGSHHGEAAAPVIPSVHEVELAQALSEVANASAEAVEAAATELASVAASHIAQPTPTPLNEETPQTDAFRHPNADPVAESAPIPEPATAAEIPATVEQNLTASYSSQAADSAAQATESAAVRSDSPVGGASDMAADASGWNSWRQIRDSEAKAAQPTDSTQPGPEKAPPATELAAMAAAAGAEKSPESSKVADSDSSAIASIVDSVLADLRPKIVEEISKKLGKK